MYGNQQVSNRLDMSGSAAVKADRVRVIGVEFTVQDRYRSGERAEIQMLAVDWEFPNPRYGGTQLEFQITLHTSNGDVNGTIILQ